MVVGSVGTDANLFCCSRTVLMDVTFKVIVVYILLLYIFIAERGFAVVFHAAFRAAKMSSTAVQNAGDS